MPTFSFEIKNIAPSPQQLSELRSLVGWNSPKLPELSSSIENSLFWVSVLCDKKLVGIGRVVGDGAMYFYIQDVIVHPEYQGQNVGTLVMENINRYLATTCQSGASIGLLAAKGKEAFYTKFGYSERNGNVLGMGMSRFV